MTIEIEDDKFDRVINGIYDAIKALRKNYNVEAYSEITRILTILLEAKEEKEGEK